MIFRGQPGQTPLLDSSGLKIKIWTMGQLHQAEEENVHKATLKYFGKRLTKRSGPFDLSWVKRMHREMLGDVWKWAGEFRRADIDPKYERWQHIECSVQPWMLRGPAFFSCANLPCQPLFCYPDLNSSY